MNTVEIAGITYDLAAIENDCWQRILKGAADYKDPFHFTTVANSNQHGVNLRIVVLRDAKGSKKELEFYTDTRSGKWLELNADNNTSYLFYNQADRIQLRLSGKASLHFDDAVADEAWSACSLSSRKVYTGIANPSSISAEPTSGLPPLFDDENPTVKQSEIGRRNFGVVITKINWMEWVWLSNKGHRRASFKYKSDGSLTSNWLVP